MQDQVLPDHARFAVWLGDELFAEEPQRCAWAVCKVKSIEGRVAGYIRVEPFVMVRFQVGKPSAWPCGINTQPESNPPLNGWHGLANELCVIEWFPGLRVRRVSGRAGSQIKT